MANFVHISASSIDGQRVTAALTQISNGIGTMQELEGRRIAAISDGAATMQSVFGVATEAEAQILSDKWAAFLAAFNSASVDFETLKTLMNETVRS